jgi:hypothetical protein
LQRLQAARCAKHHDQHILFVFRRRSHLVLVNSSVMLSLLLAMRPKCSAFQSTTIFRLFHPCGTRLDS